MVPPWARLQLNTSVLAIIPLQARHLWEILLGGLLRVQVA